MKLVHLLVMAALVALVAAPAAEAKKPRKLSESRARNFLAPIAKEIGADIAEGLKADGVPVTVVAANVGDCERKNRRRFDCDLNVTLRNDAQEDLVCSIRAGVKYKNKRSKRLVFAILSDEPKCYV